MECLFFVSKNNPTCLVMGNILHNICNRGKYSLKVVDVIASDNVELITKYKIFMIPSFLFIEDNHIIYSGKGMETKKDIEQNIKRGKTYEFST